ncbi:MAG: hypothetical protein ACKVOR_05710 [Flavobacteriales bacterium]
MSALNEKIVKWAPRVGIASAILGVLSGGYALYHNFIADEAGCNVKDALWEMELTVQKSESSRFTKDVMTYSINVNNGKEGPLFSGTQIKYNGSTEVSGRKLEGVIHCEGDSLTIPFVWKESLKRKGSEDIRGTIKLEYDPDADQFSGRFFSDFDKQTGRVNVRVISR